MPLDLHNYHQVFAEEFNSLSISSWGEGDTRWIAHTPWHGDFGDAEFTDPGIDFPFRIVNGRLQITAKKDGTGKWRSGLIASAKPDTSGFTQSYGYFECRMRLPAGPGNWPAFWLNASLPPGSTEPGVEIDVIEYYGHDTDEYQAALHVWDNLQENGVNKSRVYYTDVKVNDGSLINGFHNYGVDVAPDFITYYFDRREVWKVNTPPEMKRPFMVLVNLALGGGWPIDQTPNPSTLSVEYVRVYERNQ